jgi:hypothetical protein
MPEFRLGVRILAGLISPSLSLSRRAVCSAEFRDRTPPLFAFLSPRRLVLIP